MSRPPFVTAETSPLAPSVWTPQPIPRPAPERRTANPRTPTLRELAERTRQRASVVPSAEQTPDLSLLGAPESNPCSGWGLANPVQASYFAQGMRDIRTNWAGLGAEGRRAALQQLINTRLRSATAPALKVDLFTFSDATVGSFVPNDWVLNVDKTLLESDDPPGADAADNLVTTVYHEARHAEQWFLVARRAAATEPDAATLFSKVPVSNDAMRAAMRDPLPPPGGGATRPRTEDGRVTAGVELSAPGLCAASMEAAYLGPAAAARKATLDRLGRAQAALKRVSTRPAYNRAKQEFDRAYAAYRDLPEEMDAFAVEPLALRAWHATVRENDHAY